MGLDRVFSLSGVGAGAKKGGKGGGGISEDAAQALHVNPGAALGGAVRQALDR